MRQSIAKAMFSTAVLTLCLQHGAPLLAAAVVSQQAEAAQSHAAQTETGQPQTAQETADAQPSETPATLLARPPLVRPNPIRRAPLVAIVDLETTEPVEVVILVRDGQRAWQHPWAQAASQRQSIAVMGLRPDRVHEIRLRLTSPSSKVVEITPPLLFKTPPLPESFPPLETILSKPQLMEPGVTLFAINLWRESVSLLDYGYIIALDEAGEVVWYCDTTDRIADMRRMENGHLLYLHGNYRYAYEIDLLGRDYRRWVATNLTVLPKDDAIPIAIDTLHHDLQELPNGNFLTFATELKEFAEYPTSEFDPDAPWEPADVVCDRLVEFDPASGDIVEQLHLTDLLDRRRFGFMALSGFWKDKYNHELPGLSRDWSHANGLIYVPEDNSAIVSFRHLDCLMKIDWSTKQIRWILGEPSGWGEAWQKYLLEPVGELEWFYHQHSPQITPRGTLMMYDNGNYRARPFEKPTMAPDNQSRVLELRIDEDAMTVEQVFEYRGTEEDRFYCPFYCEADWLPQTQNILVTNGGHIELADGTPNDDVPADRQWARIFEITRGEKPEKVFEVRCDSGLDSEYGWSIYRANRYRNLYDGFNLDPPGPEETVRVFSREPHEVRFPSVWFLERQDRLNTGR